MAATDETSGGWPVLTCYDGAHLARIALPLGGIGTGTVALGGRGDLRDWELMSRPAKGYRPSTYRSSEPFFAVFAQAKGTEPVTRVLQGPLELSEYEADHGTRAANHGLPRFRGCSFEAAYPLGQVLLADPDVPVHVRLQAFNPLVPADADASGLPVAILRYVLTNVTDQPLTVSVCGALPNFIGMDKDHRDGAKGNRNEFRQGAAQRGIFMYSSGVDTHAEQWGTLALVTTATEGVTYRTGWADMGARSWGSPLLDFWDDFSADGELEERPAGPAAAPMASLAVKLSLPPQASGSVTFMLAWHFPNRMTWTPSKDGSCCEGQACDCNRIGNYYSANASDAWGIAERTVPRLPELEARTLAFVNAFCGSDLPHEVKEAALFNISTLRSQTCFRTPDGRFYGWEGCSDGVGCCFGSCTHVWNYEQATAFLYGNLAMTMREAEFAHATRPEDGLMSFRVTLPVERAHEFGKAAADGQMGCIMKMYRDWQLSGDDALLRRLWPMVKRSLEFCWIPGGWDADRDGVMEGCQHNTMDVEYFGPNPQMESWYLGALRAAEEMARYLGDAGFAGSCRDLFERGRAWTDAHLFNGEYYEHEIRPPTDASQVAPGLLVGMGSADLSKPDYQLGAGCLVDQLVGQFMAHVCGLGYLLDPEHVAMTLRSILRYNYREDFDRHFNCLRSYALGDEAALLMASYPKERPQVPFPYFTEVMTGFEYTAAVGMLYEGQVEDGLRCIRNVRQRYDGQKRSPFNEAECGHHYARAMANWAAVLALTGFAYSAPTATMTFAATTGHYFWSNGYAWGTLDLKPAGGGLSADLQVLGGHLNLARLSLTGLADHTWPTQQSLHAGESCACVVVAA